MGPMPRTAQPPGWYPDPWYPQSMRWWDGTTWTPHAQAVQPVATPDPSAERTWGQRAAVGFWVHGACAAITAVATPLLLAGAVDDSPYETSPGSAGTVVGGLLLLQLVTLAGFAGTILVAVWSNHATHSARFLGLRTAHSPGWAVAAWLVPIVSLWFPYQVM